MNFGSVGSEGEKVGYIYRYIRYLGRFGANTSYMQRSGIGYCDEKQEHDPVHAGIHVQKKSTMASPRVPDGATLFARLDHWARVPAFTNKSKRFLVFPKID